MGDSKTEDRSGCIFLLKDHRAVIFKNIMSDETENFTELGHGHCVSTVPTSQLQNAQSRMSSRIM